MKATFISRDGNDVKFEMLFTGDEFEEAIVKAYKATKDQFQVNGFRKGKAPRKMIENIYGEGVFFGDAIDDLLQTNYPAAVEELGLEVVDRPTLELSELAKGKEVVATITVPVAPVVKLKDYSGIEVEKVRDDLLAATDDEVMAELTRIQKSQARMESVEDRPAEDGDITVIDFVGTIDGEPFDGGSAENFELTLGSGQFIPGYEEQLIGHNAGDVVDVVTTFPEDYHVAELAGKEAVFKTTIHEIKKEVLPEIDDDLASDVSDFETLDEFKEDVRKNLETKKLEQANNIMKNDMIKRIVELQEVEIPAAMIEDEIDSILNEMNQSMAMQGLSMEQYMQFTGQTIEQLRDNAREQAEIRVKTRLVLKALVEALDIVIDEADVDAQIDMLAAQYGMPADQIRTILGDNIKYIEEDAKNQKVIDKLFAEVKLVDPAPVEEVVEETVEAE